MTSYGVRIALTGTLDASPLSRVFVREMCVSFSHSPSCVSVSCSYCYINIDVWCLCYLSRMLDSYVGLPSIPHIPHIPHTRMSCTSRNARNTSIAGIPGVSRIPACGCGIPANFPGDILIAGARKAKHQLVELLRDHMF